jgi:hypothetical protein
VVALVGIYLENRWMTGAAIVLLLAGLALRFLPDDPQELEAAEEE